jgi:hypothetical protein
MSNKELVIDFLNSDYYKDQSVYEKFVHPEVSISWNSSEGFSKPDYREFQNIVLGMGKSFNTLTAEISHAIEENNNVCVRFTYHVETLEHPESIALAHFFSIWEIKDEKFYKIYLMSHPADETPDNLTSYLTI